MTTLVLRRLILFGTPVALGALAAVHPMAPDHDRDLWNLIHTAQIPLAALLGISVILLLAGIRSRFATAARLAVIPWVAFFAAFDGVAGLATGALSEFAHHHPASAPTVHAAAESFADSLVLALALPMGAFVFSIVVFGATAIAVHRQGSSLPAAIAVAAGGMVWTFVHPIIGAPAMFVYLIGAVVIEWSAREARRASFAAATTA